jgi:hypothetical protein
MALVPLLGRSGFVLTWIGMSYTAWFRAELPRPPGAPGPEDRRAALEVAREFAARWGAQTCRAGALDSEAAARVAPLIDAHGVALSASCCEPLPWALPELVLQDGGVHASVAVRAAGDGLWATLGMPRDRDEARPLLSIHLRSELSLEQRTAAVRARLALVESAGALPAGAERELELRRYLTIHIWLAAGSFAKVARALAAAPAHDTVRLEARAASGYAAALTAALAGCSWAEYEAELPVAHGAALDALWTHAAPGTAELRWTDGSDEWIRWHRPDGTVQDDGKLYTITLLHDDDGIQLRAETVLDHVERDVAAAWLAARAGVPVRYIEPGA